MAGIERSALAAMAFVDLERNARSLADLAEHSARRLRRGVLGNLPRAIHYEAAAVRGVRDGAVDALERIARGEQHSFAGAPDIERGVALLESALTHMGAAEGTIKSARPGAFRKLVIGRVASDAAVSVDELHKAAGRVHHGPVPADRLPAAMTVGEHLDVASTEVDEAFAALGGERALPALERTAPDGVVAPRMLAADDPIVMGKGHRAAQARVKQVMEHGLAKVLGVHAATPISLPTDGRFLVAPTHVSMLDPVDALALGPDRTMRALANKTMVDKPLLGWLIRRFGGIPLEHGDAKGGLAAAYGVLNAGQDGMLVYPSGMLRHGDSGAGAHGSGVADLALRTNSDVHVLAGSGTQPAAVRGERALQRRLSSLAQGETVRIDGAPWTPWNREVVRESIARSQAAAIPVANADYAARRAVSNARRPLYAGAATVGVAGAIGGHELLTGE